jgi:hypothetical protein
MEINWTIVGWIAAVVLYLVGYYEGRATGYKRRKKEEQKEKQNQPPPEPVTVTETVTQTVMVDDPGLLRLKLEDQGFALDLDGARVNPISLLPEQRKRLIELLNVMRPWLEGRPTPAPAPSATVSPPAPPAPSVQPSPVSSMPAISTPSLLNRMQSLPAAEARQDIATPPTPPAQPVQPPAPSPNLQPVAPKPATIAKEDRPAAPAGSMVDQIDAILQAHLARTPLEERGIFLTQSPEGGVNVYVGLTRYGGIDEVPDPEVKAAIRAAVTEWEHKATPGLQK